MTDTQQLCRYGFCPIDYRIFSLFQRTQRSELGSALIVSGALENICLRGRQTSPADMSCDCSSASRVQTENRPYQQLGLDGVPGLD